MSEFDDMIAEGLEVTEEISGSESFTLAGKTYAGILNEFAGDENVEIGGATLLCAATLVCRRPQFSALPRPLHRSLQGKTVVVDSTSYRIIRAAVDSVSVTLVLDMIR